MVSPDSLKPKLLCLVGPTASGKSALALDLAQRLGGEIINADSRQFYRELNVGTDKPTPEEQGNVVHHLVDCTSLQNPWSAAQFAKAADAVIAELASRGRVPVIVGGTGLYIKSLLYGLDVIPQIPQEVRDRWTACLEQVGLPSLYQELRRLDPEMARRLEPNDTQRILRALEVLSHTGKSLREFWSQSPQSRYPFLKVGIRWPREVLYQRIHDRVFKMMRRGLLEEAQSLLQRCPDSVVLKKTIGYAEWEALGFADPDAVVAEIQKNSRHLAKRQMTWFQKENDIHWLDAKKTDLAFEVLRLWEMSPAD